MNILMMVALSIYLFLPSNADAEIKVITHTLQQPFGGSQSPDDARTAGIARAKREALEQFGTYIESTTVVKDSRLESDEILALTAGVTKAEVISQKNYTDGDAFGIEITVKIQVDTAVLEKSLKKLIEDRSSLKELKATRDREKKLLNRISELEKQNRKKGKNKKQSDILKGEFKNVSQELQAVDWLDKAMYLFFMMGDVNTRIDYLTKAIQLNNNFAVAYYQRGMAYDDSNQYYQAITDFDQAIKLKQDFGAYYQRGRVFSKLNQSKQAIADFDKTIQLKPDFAWVYFFRGYEYQKINQHYKAIADFDQALKFDPSIDGLYYNRAHSNIAIEEYEKAVADLDKDLMRQRSSGEEVAARYLRGMAYLFLKQYKRAISDFDQFINYKPDNAFSYFVRGQAYSLLSQHQQALSDYNQAIKLDSNLQTAYVKRGLTYAILKQHYSAIADFDQALQLNPNDAETYNYRGSSYGRIAQYNKGCSDFITACNLGVCSEYEFHKKNNLCP